MELHPTLKRQLKRVGADDSHPPAAEVWQELLARINTAYQGADQERYVLERSLEISSNEMQKLYENLKRSSESALSQEKNKLLSVLTSLTDSVFEIDQQGQILFLNPAAEKALAPWAVSPIGQNILAFMQLHLPNDQTALNDSALSELTQYESVFTQQSLQPWLAQGQALRDDNALLTLPNAEAVPISCALGPIRIEEQITGHVVVFRDMRLQKAAETELRRAKELAEDAAATKASFLATMSHEIRTPLNGVIGTATLLSDTQLDDNQQHYVSTLKRSAEVLLSLINDILDFSKMDAGKMQLANSAFSLSALMHDLDSMFHDQFTQKGVRVHYQVDPQLPDWLLGDEHRLRQVMINLVGNALKFTERGGVSVRVLQLERQNQHARIRFSVKDTGIGISPAAQARLFEAFTQADSSTTRQFGGTGLGLTISKKIVELMQGNLQVESSEGKGSHFFFDIDLSETDSPVIAAPPSDAISSTSHQDKRLLLVEDNKINQLVAGKFLQKFGYQYDIAENGAEALERIETQTYDAILMDCQMPVLDGFEATKRIRLQEQGSQRHLPIIGLTANALEGDREKCLACGMDDFTTKPINLNELESKLKHWTQS